MDLGNLLSGLELAAIGVLVVFSVLLVLQLSINALHHGLALAQRLASRRRLSQPPEAPSLPVADAGTLPGEATLEEVAAISAAVIELFGPHAHILRLQPLEEAAQSAWARQGRLEIMGSHTVPREGR